MGKNLWLRAKTKANLKPELKLKAARSTCDKELGGEIKSACENYSKSSLKTSKIHAFLVKLFIKYLEKNSI